MDVFRWTPPAAADAALRQGSSDGCASPTACDSRYVLKLARQDPASISLEVEAGGRWLVDDDEGALNVYRPPGYGSGATGTLRAIGCPASRRYQLGRLRLLVDAHDMTHAGSFSTC